jgi:hypothetical protein
MLGPSHWLKGKKILPSPLPPMKLKGKKTKAPWVHAWAFPLAVWNFSYQKSLSSFFTWANNPCKEHPTYSTSFGLKDANNKIYSKISVWPTA